MSVFDKIKERMYKCRKSRSRHLDEKNDIERPGFTPGFLSHQAHLIDPPISLIKDDLKKRQYDMKPLAQRRVDYALSKDEVVTGAHKKSDEAKKKADEHVDKAKKKADEEAKKKRDEVAAAAKKKADEAQKKKNDLSPAAKKKAAEAQKKKDDLAAAAKKNAKNKPDLRSSAQKKADDAKNKLGRGSTAGKKKADNINNKKGSGTPTQMADDSCSRPPHSYNIPYLANPAPDIGRFQNSKESLDSVTTPELNIRSGPFRQYNGGLPPYSYIGREAKKLLNKYWNYAPWHIDCLTKCFDWLDIFSYGDGERKMREVTGGIGLRESFNYFEFSQNWQTDAWVGTAGLNVDTGIAILSSLLQVAYVTKNK